MDQAKTNLGRKLREDSGDSGFAAEANLEWALICTAHNLLKLAAAQ